ncbi:hypothetical protein UFOVP1625_29 [uncultured Caudovirales phage]|uniref:Uncharacterized protein n=1 Tax=uncultured Caudovirales phage TaxID=2100421 RepID=A0A6J5T181_9CAUD|nr:hypothetical protein UFOVP1625_29 [uncultured Caudovirales phage]
MSTKLKIETYESEDACPLYFMQQGEESKAYLYLDIRDGKLYVDSEAAFVNSYTPDEQNGYLLSFTIPNNLTVAGINSLLGSTTVQSYLQTVVDNSVEFYNGSNYARKLNEEGQNEYEDLERYLELTIANGRYDSLTVYSAYDFFEHQKYAELVKEGESHAAAGTRLQLAALKDKVYISDIETEIMLNRMKDELLEEAEANKFMSRFAADTQDDG